jgi:D-mannonate dehydratase
MLLPTQFDLQLAYDCPLCGVKYWLTQEEVKLGMSFVCCNKKHDVKKMKLFKVTYFEHRPEKKTPSPKKELSQKEEAIRSLLEYYSRVDAEHLVNMVLEETIPSSVPELVRLAIAKDE